MNTEPQILDSDSSLNDSTPNCGIVMPIASMGEYSESHWSDVYSIVKEAVSTTGFKARLVSESAEATVIIRSIVQNLYADEIVVCDVSGMNPNVMFELGMRLAFDKPVVIIKDDATRFSFDINTIEHLEYPKSLRYQTIQEFKKKLSEKIRSTLKASKDLESYRSFLSNFGSFTVANLKDTTLNETEALERILNKLDKFDYRLNSLENTNERDPLLYHLNSSNVDTYRTLLKMDLNRSLPKEKFDLINSDLDKLYGDSVKLAVQFDGNKPKLRVFSDISNRNKGKENEIAKTVLELIQQHLESIE